jgi:uncharacterized lipoprotein YmbA
MTRLRFCLAPALLLAGCGHSPPTHLLTLDLAPPPIRPAYGGPALRLTAVQIPPSIDRLEFVSAASPTELTIEDQYRWSASLGSLARSALLRDLAARLPEGKVLPPDAPSTPGVARVDVAVLALDTGGQRSRMDAIVTVAIDGRAQLARRQVSLFRDHGPNQRPDQAAQDMSAMLGDLADAITGMLMMPSLEPAGPASGSFRRPSG